jgi:nitrogen fixation-related uncharacterized protein
MGQPTLLDKIREFIGGIGFRVFLWSINSTQDEYIEMILEDARREYVSDKNSAWFMK